MGHGPCPYCGSERELTICVSLNRVRYQVRCLNRYECAARWARKKTIREALMVAGGWTKKEIDR